MGCCTWTRRAASAPLPPLHFRTAQARSWPTGHVNKLGPPRGGRAAATQRAPGPRRLDVNIRKLAGLPTCSWTMMDAPAWAAFAFALASASARSAQANWPRRSHTGRPLPSLAETPAASRQPPASNSAGRSQPGQQARSPGAGRLAFAPSRLASIARSALVWKHKANEPLASTKSSGR